MLRCLASSSTLDTLVPAVYDDVPTDRHVWARLTLQAHLIKLARESKVERARRASGGSQADDGAPGGIAARGERAARARVGAQGHHARARARRALGAHRRERLGQDPAPQADRRRRVADSHGPRKHASIGSGGARPISSRPKSRIAYLGGELQDKYARYGWDLERPRSGRDRAAPDRLAASAGQRRRAAAGRRDARRVRPHASRATQVLDALVRAEAARAAGACARAGARLAAAR